MTVDPAYDDGQHTGAQVCVSVWSFNGTVSAARGENGGYVAYDGRGNNYEPADGFVAADEDGIHACAAGEYEPGEENPSLGDSECDLQAVP